MTHVRRISYCFILTSVCAAGCLAQSVKPEPSKIKLKHKSRISMDYDKFKDETTVTVGPYFLSSGLDLVMTNSQFEILGMFIFTGQKLAAPIDVLTIAFISSSKDWQFLNDQDLYVLVDGERLNLGKARRNSNVKLGRVKEMLAVDVGFDVFSSIANGTKVEMKLGPKELKLKDEHLEGFRDLASRTRP